MLFRRLVGTAVLTALLTSLSAPALAASSDTAPPPTLTKAAFAKAMATITPAPSVPPASPTPPAPPRKQSSGDSFFKSKAVVLMVGAFVVGTGYAIYSAREDRIRGSNR